MDTNDRRLVRLHQAHLRRCSAREETIRQREANLRRLVDATGVPLASMTPETLDQWQDQLRRRLAIASVRCYSSHARAFYEWATRAGHLEVNPALDLMPPKVPAGRPRPIGEDKLRVAILCAEEPVRTWLVLAAYLGLRAGEIARLTREAIDEETLDVDGKGGKPRTVPLPADLRDMLLGHVHGKGPIWQRAAGGPMTPGGVSRRCCDYLRAVGAGVVLHQLRHRFGTQAYRLSKDVREVQELLGHASPATTAVYVQADMRAAARTTDRLAQGLRRNTARRVRRKPDLAEPAATRLDEAG